jgi:UPF0755 protein
MAAGAGAWIWKDYQSYIVQPLSITEPIPSYLLEKGTSFNSLLSDLETKGVISKPYYIKLYMKLNPEVGHIKAGEYRIDQELTPATLIARFVSGDSVKHFFTIVEGTTFKQLRAALAANDVIIHETDSLSEQQVLEKIGAQESHPEGLFLAETYQIERGTTDLALLQRSYKAMHESLDKAWETRAEKLPYQSPYEALIMASIVEKETAVPSERPMIAGVFVKRMDIGMRLQTDPTVIYGMGDRYKGNIRRKDLQEPTPYNTYTIDGLPPTPIAMVGRSAVEAALNPEKGAWLYFVAKGDGSHHFSKSLREHNRAVRDYQLKRSQNYRSTPES